MFVFYVCNRIVGSIFGLLIRRLFDRFHCTHWTFILVFVFTFLLNLGIVNANIFREFLQNLSFSHVNFCAKYFLLVRCLMRINIGESWEFQGQLQTFSSGTRCRRWKEVQSNLIKTLLQNMESFMGMQHRYLVRKTPRKCFHNNIFRLYIFDSHAFSTMDLEMLKSIFIKNFRNFQNRFVCVRI